MKKIAISLVLAASLGLVACSKAEEAPAAEATATEAPVEAADAAVEEAAPAADAAVEGAAPAADAAVITVEGATVQPK